MAVKRVITQKEQNLIKDYEKFKTKNKDNLSNAEVKELIVLIAKKLNIIRG